MPRRNNDTCSHLALLLYDFVLTLPREVEWYSGRRHVSWASALFFLNRYGVMLSHLPMMFKYFGDNVDSVCSLSRSQCFHYRPDAVKVCLSYRSYGHSTDVNPPVLQLSPVAAVSCRRLNDLARGRIMCVCLPDLYFEVHSQSIYSTDGLAYIRALQF